MRRGNERLLLNAAYGGLTGTRSIHDIAVYRAGSVRYRNTICSRNAHIRTHKPAFSDINLECDAIRLLGEGGMERYIQIANAESLSILQEYQQQYQCTIEKSGFYPYNCQRRGIIRNQADNVKSWNTKSLATPYTIQSQKEWAQWLFLLCSAHALKNIIDIVSITFNRIIRYMKGT